MIVHEGHTGWVRSVAFSPDGKSVASGSNDYTVRMWDAHSSSPIGEPLRGHGYSVRSVSYSPLGNLIASGSSDRTIRLWDTNTRQQLGVPFKGDELFDSVAFSPDARLIASGCGGAFGGPNSSSVQLWNVENRNSASGPFKGHTTHVNSVSFSPDGTRIVSGSSDKTIRVWDVERGVTIVGPLEGHTSHVSSIEFSPNDSKIISCSDDGTIRFWDARNGAMIGKPYTGHIKAVWSVAFSPRGTYVASGGSDHTVRLWDIRTSRQVEQFEEHTNSVMSVAFSSCGQHIASGSDDCKVIIRKVLGDEPNLDDVGPRIVASQMSTPDINATTSGPLKAIEQSREGDGSLMHATNSSVDGGPAQRPRDDPIVTTYFHIRGRFYYFDNRRRFYSDDGALVYDGSSSSFTEGHHSLTFYPNEAPFRLDPDGLWSQDADGSYLRIHTWRNDSEAIGRHMSMEEMFHHLLLHGCVNLSSQMDAQQDTAIIINGGGFGDIWSGKLNDGTQVAIKAWRAPIIEECDYKILKRATREIHCWSRLKHDNIHQLLGVIIFKGQYLGMVSEWMQNGNVYKYMRMNPTFDRHQMSVQIASGLTYMHQCDAVHGDLKAANVLVSSAGVARIADFGLSTMSEAGLRFSETSATQAGTMRWAAPEQLIEGSFRSKHSDVYALGMTVLEIFTGNVPYFPECQRDFNVLIKLQQGIFPTRPMDHFKDNERGNRMWGLLESCWNRKPESRPTAEEVMESLSVISSI